MHRRLITIRKRCCVAALLAALTTISLPAAERNVVLFVTDDQGQDAGCYGNTAIKTPHLDALAAQGSRFLYAFATTASCSASRSVILTGLYNHRSAQYGHQHSYHHFRTYNDVESLPVMLARAGYRTARIGKYHVGPESVYQFETVLPIRAASETAGRRSSRSARSAVAMAESCRDFLGAKDERPFFLYICTSDPHRGGGRATELPHGPDRFGNLPEGKTYPGVTPVSFSPEDVVVPPFLPDTPECRAELVQYYRSVSRVDQGLGRLIQILKDTGEWDDTLFVFISDHGIAFPGAKTTVYEPGLRSPCIVRNPYAKKRGVVSSAMLTWADLVPTILEFSKATTKQQLHGRSFLPILDEENPPGWDEIYASHTFHEVTNYYPMRVVRGRRYKLIWNIAYGLPFPFASDLWAAPTWQAVYAQGMDAKYGKRTVGAYIHRPAFELYDLQADPDEIHNLANDPKYRELLEHMQEKMRAFQEKTGDPWIRKWEYE